MDTGEKIKGYCAQCGAKCGTIAHVSDGRLLSVWPDRDHPNGGFCVKGEAASEIVYNDGRLKVPMKRTNAKTSADPGWVPISWEEALSESSRRLLQLRRESGAESVAFSRPAQGGSAASDWTPWMLRLASAFGTPNVITTSHICQWGRDSGSVYTYGVGLPTPHYEEAKTILIWGHNPAISNVLSWRRIKEGQRRGARLMVVDPRRSETAIRADTWLAPRHGTDSALLLGLLRLSIEEDLYDREFVRLWTNAPFLINVETGRFLTRSDLQDSGSDHEYGVWDRERGICVPVNVELHPRRWGINPALEASQRIKLSTGEVVLAKTAFQLLREKVASFTLDKVTAITGVPQHQVMEAGRAMGTQGPLCYYTYNGIEQHINTAQTNRALCILYALTGCFDLPGGNVLFGRTPTNRIDGHDLLSREQAAKRVGLAERPLGAPRTQAQAYTFYSAALDGHPYRIRGLVSFGANILLQNADTQRGRTALEGLDFHLHVDMFENPSARFADILLPAATCWESPALSTSFGGGPATASYVQYRAATIQPLFQSRPDMQIIFDLAVHLGLGNKFWGGSIEEAFRHHLAPSGVSLAELKAHPDGLHVEVAHSFRKYAREDNQGKVSGFNTPTRKMEIYSEPFLTHGYDPLPGYDEPLWSPGKKPDLAKEFPLILTSAKLTQYLHSQGRGIPLLRRRVPEPFGEIHPETALRYGINKGDKVALSTPNGSIRVRAKITDRVQPGVVVAQTGWWEACEELGLSGQDPFGDTGANVCHIVTNEVLDPISGSVPGKAYPCRIERVHPTEV